MGEFEDLIERAKSGDESSFIGRGTEQSLGGTRAAIRESRSANGGQARGTSDARNDTGSVRDSNRASSASKFGRVVKEVSELAPEERVNLGLKPKEGYKYE